MRLGYELSYANNLTKPSDLKNPDGPARIAISPPDRLYIRIFGLPETTKQQQARKVFRMLKDVRFGTPLRANLLLDIGCAQGQYAIRVARNYPQACVKGMDFDAMKIGIANEVRQVFGLSNLAFEVADIGEVRSREEYDVALFLQIIEHLPDETAALKNVRGHLRKGGMLIITGPNKSSKVIARLKKLQKISGHYREGYTILEVQEFLRRAGFRIIKAKYLSGVLGGLVERLEKYISIKIFWLFPLAYPILHAVAHLDDYGTKSENTTSGFLIAAEAV